MEGVCTHGRGVYLWKVCLPNGIDVYLWKGCVPMELMCIYGRSITAHCSSCT